MKTLANATVGIAGLGGLGSNIAMMLARAGVGRLVVADYDDVDQSNLNRQNYFFSQIGTSKTEATKQMLARTNPDCIAETRSKKITRENAADIFKDCDIVCEALDDPEQKAVFVNAVLAQLPHVKLVAASGMAGLGSANGIRTRRVAQNFYLCGDEHSEASANTPVHAPRVMLCAAHQANMVLKLLSGEVEP